jgi:hypothetical protein
MRVKMMSLGVTLCLYPLFYPLLILDVNGGYWSQKEKKPSV